MVIPLSRNGDRWDRCISVIYNSRIRTISNFQRAPLIINGSLGWQQYSLCNADIKLSSEQRQCSVLVSNNGGTTWEAVTRESITSLFQRQRITLDDKSECGPSLVTFPVVNSVNMNIVRMKSEPTLTRTTIHAIWRVRSESTALPKLYHPPAR
jgi:hypothetical protein